MIHWLFVLTSLCLSTIPPETCSSSHDENNSLIKLFPEEIWIKVLNEDMFESVPAFASSSRLAKRLTQKLTYQYTLQHENSEIDSNAIEKILPLVAGYLGNSNLPVESFVLPFKIFFKNAKDYETSSKIMKAWKSSKTSHQQRIALLRALNESAGVATQFFIPSLAHRMNNLVTTACYSYFYPAILLECGERSIYLWKELFLMALKAEVAFGVSPYAKCAIVLFRNIVKEIWQDLPEEARNAPLKAVSLAISFSRKDKKLKRNNKMNRAVQILLGIPLPELTAEALHEELYYIDKASFDELMLNVQHLGLIEDADVVSYWAFKYSNIYDLYSRHSRDIRSLYKGKFEKISPVKTWSLAKYITISAAMNSPNLSYNVRKAFAKFLWSTNDILDMYTFSSLLGDNVAISLSEYINEMKEGTGTSVFEFLTDEHFKFFALKNIPSINSVVIKEGVLELKQEISNACDQDSLSKFNSRLACPEFAQFIVKCILGDDVLTSQASFDVLTKLFPALKAML